MTNIHSFFLVSFLGHLLSFCHVQCWPAEALSAHACSTCRRNSETLSSQFSENQTNCYFQ